MSTKHHNLSQLDAPLPSAADMKFGIVVAEWNREITEALLEGAVQTLRSAGCSDLNIQIKYVPGTFELTLGTQFFAEYTDVDAVIALGCVVQGETRHFDFICQGVTQGITQLQIQWNMPVAFGILTVNDQQQAFDRAGGKYGNKGNEAADLFRKQQATGTTKEYEEALFSTTIDTVGYGKILTANIFIPIKIEDNCYVINYDNTTFYVNTNTGIISKVFYENSNVYCTYKLKNNAVIENEVIKPE